MSKIGKINDFLKGTAYIETNGLADYHAARRVMNALRCKTDEKRIAGVRAALKQYRVTAFLEDGAITLSTAEEDLII